MLIAIFLIWLSTFSFTGSFVPYAGLKAGDSFFSSSGSGYSGSPQIDRQVFLGSFALGVAYKHMFRAEFEYGYRSQAGANSKTGEYFSQDFYTNLINFFYDVPVKFPVKPFISAGAGWSDIRTKLYNVDDENRVFAYSFGTGATYAFNRHLNLDLGYRYVKAADTDIKGEKFKNSSNDVYFGVRYAF